MHLEGEGGGEWVLDVRGGSFSVRGAGDAGPAPMVQLWQSVQDWRALAVGEDGANVDLAPPQASALDVLFVDPGVAADSVGGEGHGAVRGHRLQRAHLGDAREVRHAAGASGEPDATICVDAATYAAILARKLAPPEAYFSGKI